VEWGFQASTPEKMLNPAFLRRQPIPDKVSNIKTRIPPSAIFVGACPSPKTVRYRLKKKRHSDEGHPGLLPSPQRPQLAEFRTADTIVECCI
jgi:hypothetical protein